MYEIFLILKFNTNLNSQHLHIEKPFQNHRKIPAHLTS